MPAKEQSHEDLVKAAASAMDKAGHPAQKMSDLKEMNDEVLKHLASYWSVRPRPADPDLKSVQRPATA